MSNTKTVFTTGEAAKICKVSQQTIIRCFDNGTLKGFRVPGSRFRRIPRDHLFVFMKDNGIPTDALESGRKKLLIVDDDQDLVDLMRDGFERDGRFEIRTANNGFDAGMQVKEFRPDLVVLDVMLPDINGREVCQRVRSDRTMDTVKILCISGMVEADKISDLRSAGANDFITRAAIRCCAGDSNRVSRLSVLANCGVGSRGGCVWNGGIKFSHENRPLAGQGIRRHCAAVGGGCHIRARREAVAPGLEVYWEQGVYALRSSQPHLGMADVREIRGRALRYRRESVAQRVVEN